MKICDISSRLKDMKFKLEHLGKLTKLPRSRTYNLYHVVCELESNYESEIESEFEQGSKFRQKIDCESEANANFFSKIIAKRKRSERQIIFCEAKRSEFASLSQFFAILRKMRKFKRKFCS